MSHQCVVHRRMVLAPSPFKFELQECCLYSLERWDIKEMMAPFWRCYFPLTIGGTLIFDGKVTELRPGKGILIPSGTCCSSRLERPFEKFSCSFICMMPSINSKSGIYSFDVSKGQQDRLFKLHQKISASQASQTSQQLQFELVALIMEGLMAVRATLFAPEPLFSKVVQQAIKKMSLFISNPLSNVSLAGDLHPNSFIRIFTRETCLSPQRYYMKFRLDRAAQLLSTTEQSIEEIAELTGFGNRDHFTRAFTKVWHNSPARFRRQI